MTAFTSTAIKPNKTEKPYKGLGMEGAVARWYAALTKKSLVEFEMLARRVAGEISPGSSVLEVAPGPGYFAIELAKLGDYRVTGLDISATFVEIARSNAASAKVQTQFQRGDASRMPFDGERFDYIVCRAAFKNFSAPVAALQEMFRMLKPGGRALIIDMRRDASQDAIRQAANSMKAGALNRMIVYLTFRFMLLRRAYTKADFEQMIGQTSFRNPEIRETLIGLEVLLKKGMKNPQPANAIPVMLVEPGTLNESPGSLQL
jgi:ubiquinone/menaquinone biosynthesis C-methylase UbiE